MKQYYLKKYNNNNIYDESVDPPQENPMSFDYIKPNDGYEFPPNSEWEVVNMVVVSNYIPKDDNNNDYAAFNRYNFTKILWSRKIVRETKNLILE